MTSNYDSEWIHILSTVVCRKISREMNVKFCLLLFSNVEFEWQITAYTIMTLNELISHQLYCANLERKRVISFIVTFQTQVHQRQKKHNFHYYFQWMIVSDWLVDRNCKTLLSFIIWFMSQYLHMYLYKPMNLQRDYWENPSLQNRHGSSVSG